MLNPTGYLRSAVLDVAADLLGDVIDWETNPEYARAIVEMSRDLIGYAGDGEAAYHDVIATLKEWNHG